jgi:riboflavin kinase/FMN adenylyltransferase
VQVYRDPAEFPAPRRGSALTIGFYDGVHLGHRVVIGEVRRLAAELGAASVVLTFDPHPARVVRPESAPLLLTDLEQRLELLATTGVDAVLVLPFDEARAQEPAEEFVEEVLVGCLAARAVVVGEDFHFGAQRKGDVALLRAMGREAGFEVDGLQLLASAASSATPVSSTAIRTALSSGDVQAANRMLGRPHELRGPVVHGDGRGGPELGFPTANLDLPPDLQLPAHGIYAAWYLRPDGSRHAAAVNVGVRPTFYERADTALVEAYLLDFEGDLYGEAARLQFVARLRGEERFSSVDALIAQMHADVDQVRTLLASG